MLETLALNDPQTWIALLTLIALEIVLGIDNVIFISILASKLPDEQEDTARRLGLGLAMVTRVILLLFISVLIGLTEPVFTAFGQGVSGRDLILAAGGAFLIYKATTEIHDRLEGEEGHVSQKVAASMTAVVIQIGLLDIVFSLDSVITAVGMADQIWVMIVAVIVAIGIMLFASKPIAGFVEKHPTVKMLALSFLLMIGLTLLIEAFHVHIPKGYIYSAMGFSVFVEILNLRMRAAKKSAPVELHQPVVAEGPALIEVPPGEPMRAEDVN